MEIKSNHVLIVVNQKAKDEGNCFETFFELKI